MAEFDGGSNVGSTTSFNERMPNVFDVECCSRKWRIEIIFTIESFGALKPKEIVTQGLRIFENLLDEFVKEVQK